MAGHKKKDKHFNRKILLYWKPPLAFFLMSILMVGNPVSAQSERALPPILHLLMGDAVESEPPLKAFPKAYGAGAFATGGRGGRVIHVTNLNDSGPGSFREALLSTGKRTIVFDVSGVINLQSLLFMGSSNSDVTIAGQTAPEGGITIDGHRVYFEDVDNAIIRYIRFRGGIDGGNDSLSVVGLTNSIFDHNSFSFGGDEAGSFTVGPSSLIDRVSIQRNFFAESKTGTIVGGAISSRYDQVGKISIHNNIWYNSSHRFPNVAGNGDFDVINNIAYGLMTRLVRGNGSFNLNQIGNYYDYANHIVINSRMNMYSWESSDLPLIYADGNKIARAVESSPLSNTVQQLNENNSLTWKYFINGVNTNFGVRNRGDQLEPVYFRNSPHALLGIAPPIKTADQTFSDVPNDVGANARLSHDGSVVQDSDSLDSLWLDRIVNGVVVERLSSNQYNVPAVASVQRPSSYDTDLDGMPNSWEISMGFDPNQADQNEDHDNDGYTNLEEFLNLVDQD